ncbi:hypothetical protein BJV82DRAFT_577348 [Fennellomyces sp. T-0311]|nr:hypothetical protein BJV82DRAFT_577348 [Fennellomyces sp. T-0311]
MLVIRLLQASVMLALGATAASLSGRGSITPQDYYGLPVNALANNPPACGMPYAELNLALITAVEAMDTGSTCNLCLKVTNGDKSRSIHVLAVDLGGSGLDLSIPAFEYLFDQRYDASPATWETVDSSYCNGIWTPGKTNPNQGINGGTTTPAPTTTTATTTTKATTTTTTTTTTKTNSTPKPTTPVKDKTTKLPVTTTTTKKAEPTTTRVPTTTTTKKAEPTTKPITTTTKKPATTTTKKPSGTKSSERYKPTRRPRRHRRHRKHHEKRDFGWVPLW